MSNRADNINGKIWCKFGQSKKTGDRYIVVRRYKNGREIVGFCATESKGFSGKTNGESNLVKDFLAILPHQAIDAHLPASAEALADQAKSGFRFGLEIGGHILNFEATDIATAFGVCTGADGIFHKLDDGRVVPVGGTLTGQWIDEDGNNHNTAAAAKEVQANGS